MWKGLVWFPVGGRDIHHDAVGVAVGVEGCLQSGVRKQEAPNVPGSASFPLSMQSVATDSGTLWSGSSHLNQPTVDASSQTFVSKAILDPVKSTLSTITQPVKDAIAHWTQGMSSSWCQGCQGRRTWLQVLKLTWFSRRKRLSNVK